MAGDLGLITAGGLGGITADGLAALNLCEGGGCDCRCPDGTIKPAACCGPDADSSCACGPAPCCTAPRPAFVIAGASLFGSFSVNVTGLFGALATGGGGGVINSTLSGLPCRNRVTGSFTNVGTVTSSEPCPLVGNCFMTGLWQISGSTVRLEVNLTYNGGGSPTGQACFSGANGASGVVILNNDGSVQSSSCNDSGGSCTVSANMSSITVVRTFSGANSGSITATMNVLGVFPCSGIDPGPFPDILPSCVEPLVLPDRTLYVPRRLISIPTAQQVAAVSRGGPIRTGGCANCGNDGGLTS